MRVALVLYVWGCDGREGRIRAAGSQKAKGNRGGRRYLSLSELGDSSRLACDGKQLGGALSGTRGSGKAALSAVHRR